MNIKLVVKAPNQKYADQSFDVDLQWSVKQLKAYLSNEYPSKPAVDEQRLIYSGHLLRDDQALSQVFQPISSNDSTVTVHLVCSQKSTFETSHRPSDTPAPVNDSESNDLASSPTNANVNSDQRQANLVNSSNNTTGTGSNDNQSQSQAATAAALTASIFTQMNLNSNSLFSSLANPYANALLPGAYVPFPVPPLIPPLVAGHSSNLSPEEMIAMRQSYSLLLSNYSAGLALDPVLANDALVNAIAQVYQQRQAEQVVPPQQQQQIPQVQAPQAQNQPQQPLLAPAAIEDDEEADNRDWLDWFYWVSRALILLSVVYFYSSFTRLLLVFAFAVFMYLCSTSMYRIRFLFPRNANDQRARGEREVPQGNQEEGGNEPANDGALGENIDNPQVVQAAAGGGDGVRNRRRLSNFAQFNDGNNETSASDVTDERLSGLRMVWVVVSSLFTSLIPEQPQVNFH